MPRQLGLALRQCDPASVGGDPIDEGDLEEEATVRQDAMFQAEVARRDALWQVNRGRLQVTTVLLLGLRRVQTELALRIAAWPKLRERCEEAAMSAIIALAGHGVKA